MKTTSTHRCGGLLFVLQPTLLRARIAEIVLELQRDVSKDIYLAYASWLDSSDDIGGIKVEQCLSTGVRSVFLEKNIFILESWDRGNIVKDYVTQEVESKRKNFDLFLDCVNEQVYIRGIECDSEDLPSQKATIVILSLLLNRAGESVSNDELPPSYGKYRNELQGKIISPLNILLKKRVKKELGLKIHGKLTSFYVTWNPGKLRIGILKPL